MFIPDPFKDLPDRHPHKSVFPTIGFHLYAAMQRCSGKLILKASTRLEEKSTGLREPRLGERLEGVATGEAPAKAGPSARPLARVTRVKLPGARPAAPVNPELTEGLD